jgi:two-component system chemotaxis sensor kinase CheA
LNRVTSDLQEAVMKTRMQPIGSAWTKLPRLVRDLASASGKQITLEMNGAETELDRQILQAIGDPLTHMVRNSGDHGIEQAAVRVAAGKAPNGTIRLNAFHEGGHVIIEIVDDGAGINVARVRQKAIERGLVKPEVAATLHDAAVLRFIFEPGFSTADKITNVSGRGVGMDVVRTNIERIGGTVDLQSEPGKGSTVRIKIPLTLAIIPALVVVAAEDRYAIPQVNLLELVRLEGDAARNGVESIHGAPVYRLRGRLLPLVYLRKALGIGGEPTNTEVINIVVVQADGRPFGLVVDGVSDTEEIVVKPMSRQIKQLTSFAGTTIMGDGRVALILDVPGLARGAHVVDESRSREEHAKTTRVVAETVADLRTLLVVRGGAQGRLAIPLDRVNRLEEFKRSQIETSLGTDVVQYRDSIMPLVHVAERLGLDVPPLTERVPVVVHAAKGRAIGLVVGQIVDIVEQQLVVHSESARPGILGTAVIQGQVTDLLDLEAMLSDHDAAFAAAA